MILAALSGLSCPDELWVFWAIVCTMQQHHSEGVEMHMAGC